MLTNRHYYWIDWLRFVSAFLVVMVHYRVAFFVIYGLLPPGQHNLPIKFFYLLTRFGEEPVIVFFVLSGFLVGGNSIRKILDDQVNIRAYFIDRALRILLPLTVSSVIVVIIDLIVKVPIPFRDIIGSLLSLQGVFTFPNHNPALWSLSYEVWFYIFIGCVMIISSKQNKSSLLPFLVLALCIYFIAKLQALYFLIWLMGSFAFLLPRKNSSYQSLKIIGLLILLAGSFLLLQAASQSRSITMSAFSWVDRSAASIFLSLVACLLIQNISAAVPKTNMSTSIERLGSKLAGFSYTLYLTHYPLIALLYYVGFPQSRKISTQAILLYLIAIICALTFAYLIYSFSEKHTFKIKLFVKKHLYRKNIETVACEPMQRDHSS